MRLRLFFAAAVCSIATSAIQSSESEELAQLQKVIQAELAQLDSEFDYAAVAQVAQTDTRGAK